MAGRWTQIALRIDPDLLEQIDCAAADEGLDRSSFIRRCCVIQMEGAAPTPSRDASLLSDIEVQDERAREVIKDLMARITRLEKEVFPNQGGDPFA